MAFVVFAIVFLLCGSAQSACAQSQSSSAALQVHRLNPPSVDPAEISILLRRVKAIGVYCGENVEEDSCRFFFNAFSSKIRSAGISSAILPLPDLPGVGETSENFFVPPPMLTQFGNRFLPLDITLRLIEVENIDTGGVTLYVSGFLFLEPGRFDTGSRRLPEWFVQEAGGDVGPMESDRAKAAAALAKTLAAYIYENKFPAPRKPAAKAAHGKDGGF